MRYKDLCRVLNDSTIPMDNIERGRDDAVQDAWVRTLESRRRQGKDNPNATSVEELQDQYFSDGGLVVKAYYSALEDARRALKGHAKFSPAKHALLKEAFSLDEVGRDGFLTSEMIEDIAAQVAFEEVESKDFIADDPRYQALSEDDKKAVQRFIIAWTLKEEGYRIPNRINVQISRDRKRTGLPLTFGKGT